MISLSFTPAGAPLIETARRRKIAALGAVLRRHIDEGHGALWPRPR